MTATILRGDARSLPLADASVDLIVTSPPYWSLRSYTDGGAHYGGQIGAEPTPAAYIDSLIGCTREWVRVLKPSGSLWVNLGDKYSGAQAQNFGGKSRAGDSAEVWKRTNPKATGIPAKSLMGFPWRYAIRCIDDLGLILRAEIIWSKPNGLPESVTDRVRRSHETWFHLVKSPRYFAAVDTIREAHIGGYSGLAATFKRNHAPRPGTPGAPDQHRPDRADAPAAHALGKLPGSVWTVATQPLKVPAELGVDHFAAYPMEWPRRIIQGWSPSGICTACGEGRRPVVHRVSNAETWRDLPLKPGDAGRREAHGADLDPVERALRSGLSRPGWRRNQPDPPTFTGEACACPDTTAPTRPAVVLDPFGGTGTTTLVADVLGRHGISVDMSADYCRLAAWRTTDPAQRATALEVEKPRVEQAGQLDLFSLAGEGAA